MRGLAEGGPELTSEVRRRDVGHAGECRNVERIGERSIHCIPSAQHPPVAILDHSRQESQH